MAQFLKDTVKDNIKASALEVFTEKGYGKASVKAIAQRAGVSVGNVYRYFDNKEALYSEVISGVYNGIRDVMNQVEATAAYELVHDEETLLSMANHAYKPLVSFVALYKSEKAVFDMLLNSGTDIHYERTIQKFMDLLKEYFHRFWGKDSGIGMTDVEISALTNAMVFSVIDMLHNLDDDRMDEMTHFINTLVQGYFTLRKR